MKTNIRPRSLASRAFVLLSAAAVTLGAQALTVEKVYRSATGAVCADLSYEAADADRNVLVAWGSSDAGTSYSSWETAEFAKGMSGAGSTKCRVTLPTNVVDAAQARFFLVPATAEPGYTRATGQQFVITDFYPTPASKIVADYRWEETTPDQQRIFGSKKGINVHHYINGSYGLSWSFSAGGNWTAFDNSKFKADKSRVVVTLDGKNNRLLLVKNGETVYDKQMSSINAGSPGTSSATAPLLIFASALNTDKYANARLYSLSCYDNDELKQHFVPCMSGGVPGLRDTVTGKFYNSALQEQLRAGAPDPAVTPSETSAAFSPTTELAKFMVTSFSEGAVYLSFAASSVARELWCAWDDSDKGETFADWAHNEFVASVSASDTTLAASLPPSAVGAKAVRFFFLAAGGSYPCTYIRGDGGQAIDTGIRASTNMAVSVDFLPNNLETVQQRQFGANGNFVLASYINGSGQWAWAAKDTSGNYTGTGVDPVKKRTTISVDVPNDLYRIAVEGREVYRKSISSIVAASNRTVGAGSVTMTLFATKSTSGAFSNLGQAELYAATITTNGIPAFEFSPCVVDGVAGARNAVTGEFFGNAVTNGYTKFIPGGRTDGPTALGVAELVSPASAIGGDVFADAKFWLRGMAEDANGNGLLDAGTNLGEVRDALGRTSLSFLTYGAEGQQARFTNEFVRFPGRGVGRQMNTLYFPQTITITNEAANKGYANISTINMPGTLKGFDNKWTYLIRAKADMANPPPYSSQWLVKFGYGSGKGVMLGFSGKAAHTRTLMIYSGGSSLTGSGYQFAGMTITNGWFDLAVVADGQMLKVVLMRDGDEMKGASGEVGALVKSQILDPKFNLALSDVLKIGAEECTSSRRVYPMVTNDNYIKAFRGSIQQFAVWDRALSTAEIFSAMGWPRTDLWRVGVEDGDAKEFRGEAPADGVAVDDERWPIQNGVSRTKPLTLLFPIDGKYETLCGQMFRWKALPGSAEGRLSLTLNGRALGTQRVRPGAWSQWFVPAEMLQSGTNTAVLARADTGTGSLCADVIALGGGVQVGGSDGSFSDFVRETIGLKHLYAGDGNLHDVRRVLYCQKSTTSSNLYYHVTMPPELINERQRWSFKLGTVSCNFGTALKSHPVSVDLNGKCLGTHEMVNGKTYEYSVSPEDLVPGENVFNLRNSAPNTGSHYVGIDFFSFEPLRPVEATFMFIR